MDGEVQPKFGLMVSLILMNVTAIVFFFFATPARETTAKNQRIETNNSGNVPMIRTGIAEKVMAGDADKSIVNNDENAIVAMTPDKKEVGEGFVLQKKISNAIMKDPRLSLAEAQIIGPQHSQADNQNVPDKTGMKTINCLSNTPKEMSKAEENAHRHTEPPLAIALKKFLGETSSGVRIFFDGLKNGYTKKRIRESVASDSNTGRVSNIDHERLTQASKVNSPSDTKIKEPTHVPVPPQTSHETTHTSVWGSMESGSSLHQELISTELVMDILSSTQERTNELIYVFSKKVIPAIERMNERVADAVRLEKNLDSYTSALIDAINSIVCTKNDTNTNVKHKYSKSGMNAVRKLKHTKAFLSDLSLMRDSRIRDYVGIFSKGEHSSPNKRPVFKTLAARCWHTRNERMKRKNKKRSRRYEELLTPEDNDVQLPSYQLEVQLHQSNQGNLGQKYEILEDAPVQFQGCLENDNIYPMNNRMDWIVEKEEVLKSSEHCIIGIEDVLALTSRLDQSRDQEIKCDLDIQPFLSPVNIFNDVSVSSGMVCRSFVSEPTRPVNIPNQIVNEYNGRALLTEHAEDPENISFLNSELHQVSTVHGTKSVDVLSSDFFIVCDSRIQDSDSWFPENENISIVAHSPKKVVTQLMASSETIAPDSKGLTQQPRESNQPVSFSGEMEYTAELVHVFQQMNRQEREVAVESVCLFVLRILEAWSRPQSSSGINRISSSSNYYLSTDETSFQINRPRTAMFNPTVALPEKKAVFGSISEDCKLRSSTLNRNTMDFDQSSAEIPRDLLQSVVATTEVQIAEWSLMKVRTEVAQNPLMKVDALEGCTDPANAANQSGVGDNNEKIIMDGDITASLFSKSNESIKASKESSAATFYTSHPELSDEAFYECEPTMSAGTCNGSLDIEVGDSSRVFLERILEEGIVVHQNKSDSNLKLAAAIEPQGSCRSSSSVQACLSDSKELRTSTNSLAFEDFSASDNSSYDFAPGTDEDAYPCSSTDLSADESKAESKPKKKKWAAEFFKTFLKKKSKSASLTSISLSTNTSGSQSDSVLKPSDQTSPASR